MTNLGIVPPSFPGSQQDRSAVQYGVSSYGGQVIYDPISGSAKWSRGPNFNPLLHAYNLTPNRLKKFRAAIAGVRAGTAYAKVCFWGDSTMDGYPVGRTASAPFIAGPIYQALTGIPTVLGSTYNANNSITDARVTLGTGWSRGGTVVGGSPQGAYTAQTSATGDLSFTPTAAFDSIRIYTFNYSANGTVAVNVDGGSSLGNVVTGGGATTLGVTDFSVAAGTHTINFGPPTVGPVFICAIDTWLSTAKQVRFHNMGISGLKVRWLADTGLPGPLAMLGQFSPDLSIIQCTINDANGATPLAQYCSDMQTFITKALTYGDVIMMPGCQTTAVSPSGMDAPFVQACWELAEANGLPVLDLQHRWGSAASSTWQVDGTHPNAVGHADEGAWLARALASVA